MYQCIIQNVSNNESFAFDSDTCNVKHVFQIFQHQRKAAMISETQCGIFAINIGMFLAILLFYS